MTITSGFRNVRPEMGYTFSMGFESECGAWGEILHNRPLVGILRRRRLRLWGIRQSVDLPWIRGMAEPFWELGNNGIKNNWI